MQKMIGLFFCLLSSSACSSLQRTQLSEALSTSAANDYHVGTFVQWASGPEQEPFIRGLNPELIQNGWDAALHSTQWPNHQPFSSYIKNFGSEFVIIHLPFGRTDKMDFDFCGYIQSQWDSRLNVHVTQIDEFVKAWTTFAKETHIKRLWFYYGYVGADKDVWGDLSQVPKQETIETITECLVPLIALKKSLETNTPTTTLGLFVDTMAAKFPPDANWDLAVPILKQYGIPYGGEPWPSKLMPELSNPNFVSTVVAQSIPFFDPEQNPGAIPWAAYRKNIKGPILPLMFGMFINGTLESKENYNKRAVSSLKTYHYLAYEPFMDSQMTAADLIKMASH